MSSFAACCAVDPRRITSRASATPRRAPSQLEEIELALEAGLRALAGDDGEDRVERARGCILRRLERRHARVTDEVRDMGRRVGEESRFPDGDELVPGRDLAELGDALREAEPIALVDEREDLRAERIRERLVAELALRAGQPQHRIERLRRGEFEIVEIPTRARALDDEAAEELVVVVLERAANRLELLALRVRDPRLEELALDRDESIDIRLDQVAHGEELRPVEPLLPDELRGILTELLCNPGRLLVGDDLFRVEPVVCYDARDLALERDLPARIERELRQPRELLRIDRPRVRRRARAPPRGDGDRGALGLVADRTAPIPEQIRAELLGADLLAAVGELGELRELPRELALSLHEEIVGLPLELAIDELELLPEPRDPRGRGLLLRGETAPRRVEAEALLDRALLDGAEKILVADRARAELRRRRELAAVPIGRESRALPRWLEQPRADLVDERDLGHRLSGARVAADRRRDRLLAAAVAGLPGGIVHGAGAIEVPLERRRLAHDVGRTRRGATRSCKSAIGPRQAGAERRATDRPGERALRTFVRRAVALAAGDVSRRATDPGSGERRHHADAELSALHVARADRAGAVRGHARRRCARLENRRSCAWAAVSASPNRPEPPACFAASSAASA
jgi:hypothetical protein